MDLIGAPGGNRDLTIFNGRRLALIIEICRECMFLEEDSCGLDAISYNRNFLQSQHRYLVAVT